MHGITHTLTEQSQDQSLPHDPQCELCIAYAQLGSAVGSNDIRFDFTAPFSTRYEHARHDIHVLTLAAFTARAPPHSA